MSVGIQETGYPTNSFDSPEFDELPPDAYTEAQVVFKALQSALSAQSPCENAIAAIQEQARAYGMTQREVRVLRFLAMPALG